MLHVRQKISIPESCSQRKSSCTMCEYRDPPHTTVSPYTYVVTQPHPPPQHSVFVTFFRRVRTDPLFPPNHFDEKSPRVQIDSIRPPKDL